MNWNPYAGETPEYRERQREMAGPYTPSICACGHDMAYLDEKTGGCCASKPGSGGREACGCIDHHKATVPA